MTHDKLKQLRTSISDLDQKLLKLVAERRLLSSEVAKTKFQNDLNIRDRSQEKILLTQLIADAKSLGIDASSALSFFHTIIEDSIRTQYDYFIAQQESVSSQVVKLALLGSDTSYSAIAAANHYSTKQQEYKPQYFNSFKSIFSAVNNGQCDSALVPIENTSSGNIADIHDLLLANNLKVIAEEKLKVKHCLVGIEGASLETVKDVYSHPQAITQCQDFLNAHVNITSHYRSSTSSAIELIEEYQNPSIAAIASELAAAQSNLQIIQTGINNYQENYTRFVLLAKNSIEVPKKVPAKVSLVLTTQQKAGSLVDCLSIFKNHSINITKIESRPIPNKPWQERFYLDFEGNLQSFEVEKAIYELEQIAGDLQILGCYPQHDIMATKLDAKLLAEQG